MALNYTICVHSEITQSKSRPNGVNSHAKTKDIVFGSCSRPWSSLSLKQSWSLDGTEARQRRGHRVTVAASPPTEAAVVTTASEPLTKEDLVGYLASGCKPKENWRIGTEHEKFGFEIGTLKPMQYEQISEVLNGVAERFGWDKIMEAHLAYYYWQGKQSISLEPGGQFELSGAPLRTLHQTCAEINSYLYQVKNVAGEMGFGFLGTGFSRNGDGRIWQ